MHQKFARRMRKRRNDREFLDWVVRFASPAYDSQLNATRAWQHPGQFR